MSRQKISTRVLVIDDNEGIVFVLKNFLEENGFTVETFTDPRPAIEKIKSNTEPLIVVTDFDMPYITGVEILYQVENFHPEIQGILISGIPEEAAVETDRFTVIAKDKGFAGKVVEAVRDLAERSCGK